MMEYSGDGSRWFCKNCFQEALALIPGVPEPNLGVHVRRPRPGEPIGTRVWVLIGSRVDCRVLTGIDYPSEHTPLLLFKDGTDAWAADCVVVTINEKEGEE